MNKLDSALVTASLEKAGFRLTDTVKEADAVLINTCSVREHAEQRVLSHLGHLKHIKKQKPNVVVAVIGCMAQRLGPELLDDNTVDIVCGPAQIPQIPQIVTSALNEKHKLLSIKDSIRQKPDDQENLALDEFESTFDRAEQNLPGQAFVRVMRGCDSFCAYCVVPYVRGPEVSRPPAAIIDQVKRLADEGVKQVTLLGQAVNKYKYAAGQKSSCLADLLYLASEVDGIDWIKFVTNYPSEQFYDEILKAMADLPKVCPYLHIPAQSGSDKILRAMNRHYTAAQYLEMLDKARSIVPGIALSGDFIVGYPGETEEDFHVTVDLVKKARYKNAFIFKYSPRPGTKADKNLTDTVPHQIKRKRNTELLAVQEKISAELAQTFLGQTVKVLVEGLSKKPHLNSAEGRDNPQLVGRTATDWIVVFNGPPSLAGRFVNAKITKTAPLTLFADPAP
ncbi:MAG: tRNA (N6-isopentenyl adenosine(37)-C2)-methylthiotransferase MiaB [Planctomycetota bacterium]|nr:MAG: tRNA (N6-isopentenyl adenosine(37)-C2)-methylthiotransferase MiaB [Planctomycetota bacterium]